MLEPKLLNSMLQGAAHSTTLVRMPADDCREMSRGLPSTAAPSVVRNPAGRVDLMTLCIRHS